MKKGVVIPIILILLIAIGGLGYKVYLDYNELEKKERRIANLNEELAEKEEAISELDENINELKENADNKVLLRNEARGIWEADNFTLVLTRGGSFYFSEPNCNSLGIFSLINNDANIRLQPNPGTNLCTAERFTVAINEETNEITIERPGQSTVTLQRVAGYVR